VIKRFDDRVLNRILGQLEVTQRSDQRRDESSRLLTNNGGQRSGDRIPIQLHSTRTI